VVYGYELGYPTAYQVVGKANLCDWVMGKAKLCDWVMCKAKFCDWVMGKAKLCDGTSSSLRSSEKAACSRHADSFLKRFSNFFF